MPTKIIRKREKWYEVENAKAAWARPRINPVPSIRRLRFFIAREAIQKTVSIDPPALNPCNNPSPVAPTFKILSE